MTFYGTRYHRKDIINGFRSGTSARQLADELGMPMILVIGVINKAGMSHKQMTLYLPPVQEVSK